MNRSLFLFLYSFSLAILIASLFPALRVIFFAPFLVLAFYQKDKVSCLWMALGCGLFMDLLAAETRFGAYALNYCLTTYFLYPYKSQFFEDRLMTLPIMTYLFAFLSTILHLSLLYIFGQTFHFSWAWIGYDLCFMSLYDSLYAGVFFTIPSLLFPKAVRKRGSILFSSKRGFK